LSEKMPSNDDIREHAEIRYITFAEAYKELCGNWLEKNRKEYHRKVEKIFKDGHHVIN